MNVGDVLNVSRIRAHKEKDRYLTDLFHGFRYVYSSLTFFRNTEGGTPIVLENISVKYTGLLNPTSAAISVTDFDVDDKRFLACSMRTKVRY